MPSTKRAENPSALSAFSQPKSTPYCLLDYTAFDRRVVIDLELGITAEWPTGLYLHVQHRLLTLSPVPNRHRGSCQPADLRRCSCLLYTPGPDMYLRPGFSSGSSRAFLEARLRCMSPSLQPDCFSFPCLWSIKRISASCITLLELLSNLCDIHVQALPQPPDSSPGNQISIPRQW